MEATARGAGPPADFDEYRIIEELGRGAFGRVYLAHDRLLDRLVAIKFVSLSGQERARFLVEARAIARVQHPNVVTVHRVGEQEGRPFIVSEYLRGERLDALAGRLTRERLLEVAIGLARGLAAAHRRGVLHRDIKPQNAILAEDGTVKLLDFGAAKLIGAGPAADQAGREADGSEASTLFGTPLYLAPELWQGEEASARSDLYSLGVLLYVLASGRPPHTAETVHALALAATSQDARPLAEVAPVEPGLAGAIDRCLRRDPAARFASADALRDALEALAQRIAADDLPPGNPYRGLDTFEREHRAIFFGRAADVRAVTARLRAEPFVVIAGDSGIGKSSLCRAGVLPAFDAPTLAMVPGRRPFAALVSLLAGALGADLAELVREADRDPPGIGRALRRRLGPAGGAVLFVDQLEELLTVSEPLERERFLELLPRLLEPSGALRALATARGDFLTRLAALPTVADAVDRGLYLLRPLTRDGLREAVVWPARLHDVSFESPELVKELLDSGGSDPGGLPLLQFTLAQLWDARDTDAGQIRRADLAALGGVAGALERHADATLERLPREDRARARRILVSLVTREGVRARAREEELLAADPAARPVLGALIRARLVVAREAEGGTVEIAHEILLRSWRTLRAWLAEDGEAQATRERLERAAAEWHRLGQAREALWRARQLAEVDAHRVRPAGARELGFLRASRAALRRRRWLAIGAAAAAVALPVAIYAGIKRSDVRRRDAEIAAQLEAAEPLVAAAAGDATRAAGLRAAAVAAHQAGDPAGGDRVWSEATAAARRAQATLGQAERALERALFLDRERADVRRRLGEALFARLEVDEALRADDAVADDLARLRLFDTGEAFVRRWAAPARIAVVTRPAAADLEVLAFQDQGGRLVARRLRSVASPTSLILEQGSYLLVARAAGRAEVRYPLVAGRGESLRVAIELPAARDVPAGFAYVPAGRFLFGSAEDDLLRQFLVAAPQHALELPAFLIARTETTMEEYLRFVDQLPAAEAERRRPRTGSLGLHGRLEVKRTAGRWTLSMQPTSVEHRAAWGELIEYPGRSANARQDWRLMPVSGVSPADAIAYAAWLDRTGAVPRARLCDEREWEKAARGADGRPYPHGTRLSPREANLQDSHGGAPALGPDQVGAHPESRSVYGLDDMAGNVYEVTRAALPDAEVVARGGAFTFSAEASHAAQREAIDPAVRDVALGFRICADLPPGGAAGD